MELTVDEAVEHVQRDGGLVHGNHVTGIKDLQEREALSSLESTNLLTTKVPGSSGGLLEALLSGPDHVVGPAATTEVIADEIFSTRVDQNRNIGGKNVREIEGKVADPITEQVGVNEPKKTN